MEGGPRWCGMCHKVSIEASTVGGDDGAPRCPHCGAGATFLQEWSAVRSRLKGRTPAKPEDGKEYDPA